MISSISHILSLGNVLEKIFSSDDHARDIKEFFKKFRDNPNELQLALNKIEAKHRSIFVAGWRPFIGWVCGIGLANTFIINPWLQWLYGVEGPQLPLDVMIDLVIAMLGLGTLRTFEKFKDKAK